MTPLDALCRVPFHELPDAARARVLNRLADTELFVALAAEPAGNKVTLRLFDLGAAQMAVAADLEERLSGFFGEPVAYAALPGRALAAMLSAQQIGLMVNSGDPSEMLLDAATLGWLAQALNAAPEEQDAAAARLSAPRPEMVAALSEPLAQRLTDMAGLAESAALVEAHWPDGASGHLIAVSGASEEERPRIAKALSELMAFLPPLPDRCDVAFDLGLPAGALILRLDEAEAPPRGTGPVAPGSDPDKPPKLRF
ncbi:hypothetical protein [Paracoccus sediminicola]|uniref:hypothetical protein n=1 Tax=Paracoccus sediminicola TaxID=3017783 RepID=UPI0022F0A457|nr:hypothetical protein [Paracoccus sediminicola]WBU55540.1 hypothetical protein PAF18_08340 [Paracoccus sediminicola]